MKITLIAPPWYPVPPSAYGGIELVVALLAQEFERCGHDVTVMANGDSRPAGVLRSPLRSAPSNTMIGNPFIEARHALGAYAETMAQTSSTITVAHSVLHSRVEIRRFSPSSTRSAVRGRQKQVSSTAALTSASTSSPSAHPTATPTRACGTPARSTTASTSTARPRTACKPSDLRILGGRYGTRTHDLCRVKAAL